MRNMSGRSTLVHIAAVVALCATASTTALASAGGSYQREPPKPSAEAQRENAERTSQEAWVALSEQVPDLAPDEAAASRAKAVPEAADTRPVARVCKRVAVHGTRVKRRVCKTVRETAAEARERELHSEALLRYQMFQ